MVKSTESSRISPVEVILDNIRSFHNVGSIFRTADGAGVKKIYLCGITPTPIDQFSQKNLKLTKVSLGAEDFVAWEYKKSTSRLIRTLRKRGYQILALEQHKSAQSYKLINLSPKELDKTVLVVGTEVKGINQSVLELVDTIIEIPMKGQKESLNVSVAFGVAIYQLTGN